LTSTTDALGDTTTQSWSTSGLLAAITDANIHTTSFLYDSSRRLTVIPPGHDEDAADAEQSAGVGERLAVVACRAAQDTAALHVVGQPADQVDARLREAVTP
jgi:YD repeat-containing protein